MCNLSVVTAQNTLYVNDSSLRNIITYSADERIWNDMEKKQIHLFGNAKVEMEGLLITAGYILLDLDANEISAKYRYDKDSNKVEFPVFTDGGESVTCHTLKYNTKTQKGFLEELAIKQDEFYFHMETAKRHPNDEIHLLKGRLTTCDLDEPHYHFQLSKGVIVPNERIVTGPMNLWMDYCSQSLSQFQLMVSVFKIWVISFRSMTVFKPLYTQTSIAEGLGDYETT